MPKKVDLVNIILVLLIFPAASFLVKDYLVYRYSGKKAAPVKVTAALPTSRADIRDYASIVEAPVFPAASRKLRALSADLDASGKTADPSSAFNDLKLIGTFAGGTDSFAIFQKKGEAEEKPVRKGDRVFDAGVLREIYKGKVVISSGSGDYTINMPTDENIVGGALNLTNVPAQTPSPQTAYPGDSSGGKNVSKTGEREWVINQKAILNALNDIGQVLSDARLTPVVTRGEVEGFLVGEIKPRGIFDAIGLKNGDVLKRVNGYEIVSPERAVQVLSALKGETKIDLDIVRGGQKMSFHYDIR